MVLGVCLNGVFEASCIWKTVKLSDIALNPDRHFAIRASRNFGNHQAQRATLIYLNHNHV